MKILVLKRIINLLYNYEFINSSSTLEERFDFLNKIIFCTHVSITSCLIFKNKKF